MILVLFGSSSSLPVYAVFFLQSAAHPFSSKRKLALAGYECGLTLYESVWYEVWAFLHSGSDHSLNIWGG